VCSSQLRDLIATAKEMRFTGRVGLLGNKVREVANPQLERPLRDAADFFSSLPDGEGVEQLIALSDVPFRDAVHASLRALGASGDKRALPQLIAVAEKEDQSGGEFDTRVTAVHALCELCQAGDSQAVGPLIELLTCGRELCQPAAEALGKIRDPRAIEPLLARCQRSWGDGAAGALAAARALGRLYDVGAALELRKALSDPELRDGAVLAFTEIDVADPSIGPMLVTIWRETPSARSPKLLELIFRTDGDARVGILREALQMPPSELPLIACQLVYGGNESLSGLRQEADIALKQAFDKVRSDAAEEKFDRKYLLAIGHVADMPTPIVEALRKLMLEAKFFWTSIWIAAALALIEEEPEIYVRFLLEVMYDADEGAPKLPELSPLLEAIPQMRAVIYNVASGETRSPSGPLVGGFDFVARHSGKSPWFNAQEALRAVAEERPKAVKTVLAQLQDDYPKQVKDLCLLER